MLEPFIQTSWKKLARASFLAAVAISSISAPAIAQLTREQKLQVLQDMNRRFEEQNAERRARSQSRYDDGYEATESNVQQSPSSWQQFNQDFNAQAQALYQRKAAEAAAASQQAELARQAREIEARNRAAAEYKQRTYGRSETAGQPVNNDGLRCAPVNSGPYAGCQ